MVTSTPETKLILLILRVKGQEKLIKGIDLSPEDMRPLAMPLSDRPRRERERSDIFGGLGTCILLAVSGEAFIWSLKCVVAKYSRVKYF